MRIIRDFVMDLDDIIGAMEEYQRVVMRELARIEKSPDNVFSEKQLSRRKACFKMHVDAVLKELAAIGLVNPVKKGVWQTTPIGRRVEHALELRYLQQRYGFKVKR